MEIANLYTFFATQPKYRLAQAERAVFVNLIDDWGKATIFSKELRQKLNDDVDLKITAQVKKSGASDSVKALITLSDGKKIETILLPHKDGRRTACLSSQVGCPLGCKFCATGQMGFIRNLTKEEIIEQVVFWNRYLKDKKERVSNVVFMGMGEPFLNYDNVSEAIKFINRPDIFSIGWRNISISTAGVLPGIKRFAQEDWQVNLAISLHAPDDELREKIMPCNKSWPLDRILDAVNDYIKRTNRRVMFEYVLLKDINDSDEHARWLAALMKRQLYFVNLIAYNQTKNFKPSNRERTEKFLEILRQNGVFAVERYRFGQDINAGCGQLAGKH